MFLEKLVNSRRSGVVAVETRDDDAVFFYHDGGGFRQETVPFTPMLLLSAPEQLEDFSGTAAVSPFDGNMVFRFLAKFPTVSEYELALKHLKKGRGAYFVFRDYAQQILQQEETRLSPGWNSGNCGGFSSTSKSGLRRASDFPNPDRAGDEIVIISMCDSTGWELALSQDAMGEKELIETFVRTVAERDRRDRGA